MQEDYVVLEIWGWRKTGCTSLEKNLRTHLRKYIRELVMLPWVFNGRHFSRTWLPLVSANISLKYCIYAVESQENPDLICIHFCDVHTQAMNSRLLLIFIWVSACLCFARKWSLPWFSGIRVTGWNDRHSDKSVRNDDDTFLDWRLNSTDDIERHKRVCYENDGNAMPRGVKESQIYPHIQTQTTNIHTLGLVFKPRGYYSENISIGMHITKWWQKQAFILRNRTWKSWGDTRTIIFLLNVTLISAADPSTRILT